MKQYTGVTWNRQKQQWHAAIRENGILYECGYYTDEIEAVKARDRCIITHGLNVDKLQVFKPVKK